jgi:membrane protease YdiL (CAAX protease family)
MMSRVTGEAETTPGAARPLAIAAVVVLVASLASWLAPAEHDATLVGGVFLVATWGLVLRGDTASIREHGLGLGGLLEPERIEASRVLGAARIAVQWAVVAAITSWPWFVIAFPIYYGIDHPFAFRGWDDPLDLVLGQLFVIALPEEAFFRGYLQTRLDRAWPPSRTLAGGAVGGSLVVTSVVFALAHVLTQPHPARLAVFFPSLLFGWLRARTGGVGASVLFHAGCNVLSHTLKEGFGG